MKTKLINRLPQTADRLDEFQNGIEDELRVRALLFGSFGIVATADIDNAASACSVTVNTTDGTAFDVAPGRVVFPNGESVLVTSTDLVATVLNTLVTDGQVIRLEYGEIADGTMEGSPFYDFGALPKISKKTPRQMLVVETVTAYNAQPSTVKDVSIVLAVARFLNSVLTIDNTRDTYTFSRPWFSPVDVQHRSLVGSGKVTETNPHGTAFIDESVGSYSAVQAFMGAPALVLARPTGFGRLPGALCEETIPAGNFANDPTGLITGKPGAFWATLGFWPDRLLSAFVGSDLIAAWIPHGKNVIAVSDPVHFGAPANLLLNYTKVQGGSLPGSPFGLTTVEIADPTADELLVAGGNAFTKLNANTAIFTDVGLIPMYFDILVDGTGKVYKRPEVVYCNTKLDTIGASPVSFTSQPRAPTRLRLAISNYNPAFTQVIIQVTGLNEAGAVTTEQLTWNGPFAAPAVGVENSQQWLFTLNVFASVSQLQVLVRNNDGPNTTLSVFAEGSPERPAQQDDLLLATVFWSGSDVSGNYATNPDVIIDRRVISAGGVNKGSNALDAALNQPMLVEGPVLNPPVVVPGSATKWVTIVEDFTDPQWMCYPQIDATVANTHFTNLIEFASNSLGARNGYASRRIPFLNPMTTENIGAMWLRMLPGSKVRYPTQRLTGFSIGITLYAIDGSSHFLGGSLSTGNSYPPFQVAFSGGPLPALTTWYSMEVTMLNRADFHELFQGFVFSAWST